LLDSDDENALNARKKAKEEDITQRQALKAIKEEDKKEAERQALIQRRK